MYSEAWRHHFPLYSVRYPARAQQISAHWGSWTYWLYKSSQPGSSYKQLLQPVLAIRHAETTKDLQSHVSVAGQNFWKEKEEILAKPHDSQHGHLMLACLSLSFCSCFPSAAQTLSAATWPTYPSTLLQSHQSSRTTCSGRPHTTEPTKLYCQRDTSVEGDPHQPQLQLTAVVQFLLYQSLYLATRSQSTD